MTFIPTKILSSPKTMKAVGNLCDPSKLAPVLLLESTVVAGRTHQAQKRGGWVEARERITEELLTSAVWLFGVKTVNMVIDNAAKVSGHKTLKHLIVDVGQDHGRSPINYLKKASKQADIMINEKLLYATKFGKIAFAALAAVFTVGSVIPKFNQKITRENFEKMKTVQPTNNNSVQSFQAGFDKYKVSMNDYLKKCKKTSVAFAGGAYDFLRVAAHNLENHDIARMLVVDTGVTGGRATHARNKDERNEILFRDLSSLYFYMVSTGQVAGALTKVDKYGSLTKVSPAAVEDINNSIIEQFKEKGEMSTKELEKIMLGNVDENHKKVLDQVAQNLSEKGVKTISTDNIDEFKDAFKGVDISKEKLEKAFEKAKSFAKDINFVNDSEFITIEQVDDVLRTGKANESGFLKKAFANSVDGFENPEKYISQKKLKSARNDVMNYVSAVFEYAKGKSVDTINKDFLDQVKTRSVSRKLGYTGAGLMVSAIFLSTIIPKTQYLITRLRTGSNAFPGVKAYEHNK